MPSVPSDLPGQNIVRGGSECEFDLHSPDSKHGSTNDMTKLSQAPGTPDVKSFRWGRWSVCGGSGGGGVVVVVELWC